jgi:hypothetical protein
MNDHRACATIFINLQAMECWLKDNYWLEITRYRLRETGNATLTAQLRRDREHIFDRYTLPTPLIFSSDVERVMEEKTTVTDLMQEIWQTRIPDEAKRTI